jgi:crotonobetainyl-CoA:carnitine CoA-transferase CaiB-like acyl-CoA transferase
VKDEQLRDRGYFVEVEHPELDRTFTYPGAPYKLSETPWQLKSRAPLVGEHNLDVLNDWLDLSPEESAELLTPEAAQID